MNTYSRSLRPVTSEDVIYGIALKKAARLAGAFRQQTSRQVIILLKLPEGAVPQRYEAAAIVMAREMEVLHGLAIILPKINRKGMLDTLLR